MLWSIMEEFINKTFPNIPRFLLFKIDIPRPSVISAGFITRGDHRNYYIDKILAVKTQAEITKAYSKMREQLR